MMKDNFDIEDAMFSLLHGTSALTQALSGGIYHDGNRPADSNLEDIVINTIYMTEESSPQLATTNVNIYAPDKLRRISGKQVLVEDRPRLKALSKLVKTAVRAACLTGISLSIETTSILNFPDIKQHCVNIRVSWFIVS